MFRFALLCRGRILGRNWDINLKTFTLCYSQSPLLKRILLPTFGFLGFEISGGADELAYAQIFKDCTEPSVSSPPWLFSSCCNSSEWKYLYQKSNCPPRRQGIKLFYMWDKGMLRSVEDGKKLNFDLAYCTSPIK